MENEIYQKLELAQADFKSQLEEILKPFPELKNSRVSIRVELHDVPKTSMPEESILKQTSNMQWYSYPDDYFKPVMYSLARHFKMIFEDETETTSEEPGTSIQS